MLQEVQPNLLFWCYLGFFSSLAWLFSSLMMDFPNKITGGPVASIFLRLTIIFSWFVVNLFLYKVFRFLEANPQVDSFFNGCERVGKTVGSALLFFGNVGLYYYSEKSIACMLTFLFLALYCLCALFCIQPYTDFGVLGFILSASLNRALCLFGLQRINTWLVLIVCVLIAGLHYRLEPVVQVVQPPLPAPPPTIILEAEMEEIIHQVEQLSILNHPFLEEEEPLIPLTSTRGDRNPATS